MKKILAAAALLILILWPGRARAIPVTFEFTGAIFDCFICFLGDPPGERISPTSFQGQYTFDSVSGVPDSGFINIAGVTTPLQNLQIIVQNDVTAPVPGLLSDRYFLRSDALLIGLFGCNANIFQEDTKFNLFNLDLFRPNCGILGEEVVIHAAPVYEAFARLTTLYAVPEPGSMLLAGWGLIGVAIVLRRRGRFMNRPVILP